MSEIEIEIDGQLVKANQGDSIINIADREGIESLVFATTKSYPLPQIAECAWLMLKAFQKRNPHARHLQPME